jgi:hypothetical protein
MKQILLEKDTMQWDMAELNRLKKDKNRKYNCPVQLALYSQTVEVTLYLTFGSYFPYGNSLSITLVSSKENVISGTVKGILREAGPVDIVAGSYVHPNLLRPYQTSPTSECDANTGCHCPPISEATSLDSSTCDGFPNAINYQPHHDAPPGPGAPSTL